MKLVLLFALALYARLSLVEPITNGADGDITKLKYATHHTFPWKFDGVKERTILCGGTLIKLNAIISTAKCLRQKDLTKISVHVGTATFADGTAISPTKVIIKEDYNVSTALRNFGIMIIPPQTLGTNIAPADLPEPGVDYYRSIGTGNGLGRTKYSAKPPAKLQTVTSTVIFNTECNINPYQPPYPLPAKTNAREWDLCTSVPPVSGNGCFGGDEGSGLVVVDPATGLGPGTDPNILVGIFNFGAGSGNCLSTDYPVYVRIAKVYAWIVNVTSKNP